MLKGTPMLSTTTTALTARISEAVAIDNETAITPVRVLPLVTLTCHEIIIAQDASLASAARDVYVKSQVILELDATVTLLEDACNDHEQDNERMNAEIERHLEQIEELTGEHNDAASNVASLLARVTAYEADMEGTLKALADARKASVILLDAADTASKDADRAVASAKLLQTMLDASGKREDEQYETLMGVRALAQSDMLTDAEKVALILRMVK